MPSIVDGEACYPLTPEEFARYQRIFVHEFGTSIVAGCCGTTPEMFREAIPLIGYDRPTPRLSQPQENRPYEANVASLYTSVRSNRTRRSSWSVSA